MTEKIDPVEVTEYREEIARVKERVISPDGWVLHWGVERAERLLDEIDRLRSALAAAEAAGWVMVERRLIEPFAAEAANWAPMWADHWVPRIDPTGFCAVCDGDADLEKARFTVGDLRALAASLAQQEKET